MSAEKNRQERFNQASELEVGKYANNAPLSTQEKQKVWQVIQGRDQKLEETQKLYAENKNKLINQEYDRLRGEQKPVQNLNYGRSQPNNAILLERAKNNIEAQKYNDLRGIDRSARNEIVAIIQQAKEKNHSQEQDLQRDFNNAHNNTP